MARNESDDQTLRRRFAEVERLRDTYLGRLAPATAPGSVLDHDTRRLPLTSPGSTVPVWMPASTTWSGICGAVQQLEALRLLIEEAHSYIPVATASLIRGAWLSAVLAAYVVCPVNAAPRNEHYLAVMRDELFSQSRHWQSWLDRPDDGSLPQHASTICPRSMNAGAALSP